VIKRIANTIAGRIGYQISRKGFSSLPLEWREDLGIRSIWTAVQPYTMTSAQRTAGLIQAVRYVTRNRIAGACVECGVWRGGSSMAVCLALLAEKAFDREVFLYDTFTGMSEPSIVDRDFSGDMAATQMAKTPRGHGVWCEAGIEDVRKNMDSTNYPSKHIHLVQGKVEDTIPGVIPESIAVLRLDTDWYESTRHELQHLYSRLALGGVLVLDDYGHWLGARKAVDEFFQDRGEHPLLMPLDFTGRIMVKTRQ
jgi:O-methyltransferase